MRAVHGENFGVDMKLKHLRRILHDEEVPDTVSEKIVADLRQEWKFKPEGKYAITICGKIYVIEKEKE